jgi:cell division protein FtsL
LLNDKDVLLNWGKPQLEALYATRIGYWQVEKLQLQLRIKALKRKIEMVQSAINRNIPVDLTAIELSVATELAEAEYRIMQETGKIENAKNLLSNLSSPERSSELRKLYRQFAKKLHPDVNPDLTAEQQQIWHQIKDAYEPSILKN